MAGNMNGRPADVPVGATLSHRSNTLFITVGDRFCYVEGTDRDMTRLGDAEAAINEGRPSPEHRASYDRRTGILTLPGVDNREPVQIPVMNAGMAEAVADNINSRRLHLNGRRLPPGYLLQQAAKWYPASGPEDTRGWEPAPSPQAASPPKGRAGFIAALGRRIDRIARLLGLSDPRADTAPARTAPVPRASDVTSSPAGTPSKTRASRALDNRTARRVQAQEQGTQAMALRGAPGGAEAGMQADRAAALAAAALPQRIPGASEFKPDTAPVVGRRPVDRQQQSRSSSHLKVA